MSEEKKGEVPTAPVEMGHGSDRYGSGMIVAFYCCDRARTEWERRGKVVRLMREIVDTVAPRYDQLHPWTYGEMVKLNYCPHCGKRYPSIAAKVRPDQDRMGS